MHTDRKIVITGGPGTGKTSIIDQLKSQGHFCLIEISREVTLAAKQQGIEQLFLTDPLLFSQKLLEGRIAQYKQVENQKGTLFFDRGIPDVVAYMDYSKSSYPEHFVQACRNYRYDTIFLLPPWEEIYHSDNERYENFNQAKEIHHALKKTYEFYGYSPIDVPIGTVPERIDFIKSKLK